METDTFGSDRKPDRDLHKSTEKAQKKCCQYAKRFCIKETVQNACTIGPVV